MRATLLSKVAFRLFWARDQFFSVKMKVNELVINEVARGVHPEAPDSTESQNDVAVNMLHSSIHDQITELSKKIVEEINRQKKSAAV